MITLKSIIGILLYTIFCLVLLSLWGFFVATHPPRMTSNATPKTLGVNYEDVTFRTEDNILIHGWFVPAKKKTKRTIILLHGYGADKSDLVHSRLFLYTDFNLLLFDFRYFGKSEGSYSSAGLFEVQDLLAAIQFLKTRGIQEVGVWGLSMGAAVGLMAAHKSKSIKAVVAESSYARLDMMANRFFNIPLLRYPLGYLMRLWGYVFLGQDLKTVAPVDVAMHLTIPVLLIYSEADLLIRAEHGVLLKKAFEKNPQADVWILKTSPHGGLEEGYDKRVFLFFKKYL